MARTKQTARSFRQLRRFHHLINSDKVFGTHRGQAAVQPDPSKDHHGSQEAQTEISSADGSLNAGGFNCGE